MSNKNILFRCYAYKEESDWVAINIDFTLATQGETFEEVEKKMVAMVQEYILDAATTDREYAEELLNRRAPMKFWVRYYYYSLLFQFHLLRDDRQLFYVAIPYVDISLTEESKKDGLD